MKSFNLPISIILLVLLISSYGCKETRPEVATKMETETADSVYIKMGKDIALSAQSALAKNLMNAISNGGTEYAVEFCNTHAVRLTDSMAQILNTSIKRVSDKPRNQSNQAHDFELEYMNQIYDKMKKGEKPEPIVTEAGSKMIGLYPIITNTLCLKCHGTTETDVNKTTLEKIKKRYPDDKAIGYSNNELRGLWVIEMKKTPPQN